MNIPIDEITSSLFKKPLDECSVDELHQLVQQYPYFGPAHLLLAKKLKKENSPSYPEQLKNTSLYFQNPVWLDHLLNDDADHGIMIESRQLTPQTTTTNEVEEAVISPDANETETQPEVISEPATMDTEPSPPVPSIEETEIAPAIETTDPGPVEPNLLLDVSSIKIQAVTPDKEILFEPYHTVDYFASQGIKFREEEKPRDQFSMQLKSFTEWLKLMKKVPVSEIIAKSDPGIEKKVEQMAEYSLAERHVITEAMAEVWKKQGNKAKAEDIYNKLSLLDPSKSSYFAAKIEELKKTS